MHNCFNCLKTNADSIEVPIIESLQTSPRLVKGSKECLMSSFLPSRQVKCKISKSWGVSLIKLYNSLIHQLSFTYGYFIDKCFAPWFTFGLKLSSFQN